MGKAFMKAYSQFESQPQHKQLDGPDKTLLALYFCFSLRMNISIEQLRGNLRGVLKLLTISYHIGRAFGKEPIVSSTTSIRRIQKLGDYYGAARIITKALEAPDCIRAKERNLLRRSKLELLSVFIISMKLVYVGYIFDLTIIRRAC
ncbi:hypothetical protein V8E54_006195 [Elaphomyces granulatus]|jgi:hypothetical protein